MRLRKQSRLKAAIVAAAIGLMVAFFGLVRSETPASDAVAAEPASPTPDYNRFCAPGTTATPAPPVDRVQPHTRSRAS